MVDSPELSQQADSGARSAAQNPTEAAGVTAALQRILTSPGFAGAPRRADLLRYLVERTLAGEGDRTTEYGIGLDVFGRPTSFDQRTDSIVRTEVSRLRQKLRDYYLGPGAGEAIEIAIPPRSYRATFTRREGNTTPAAPGDHRPAATRTWWPALAAAVVILLVLLLALRSRPSPMPASWVVVLPFQDYSPDRQQQPLADAVTEELTNQLAQQPDLRVVARTSAFAFKGKGVDIRQIGRQLNVGAALEGSLVKSEGRVRVTAQLNRTSDGYHLWSRSFDVPYAEIGTVQAEITQSVIATVLSGRERAVTAPRPPDPEAHDLYFQASYQLSRRTPESLAKSLELYEAAVAKDPSYSNAYLGVARAEISLIHLTAASPLPAFRHAREALEKALAVNPADGEALGELADIDYVYDWDWVRAEREFRLALQRGARATTHSYYGWGLATRGRFDEAQRQLEIAQDLDPLGAGPRFNQAIAFILEHRFSDARHVLQRSVDSKTSVLDAHLMLGVVGLYQHDCEQANEHFTWFARQFPSPVAHFGLALNAVCRGQKDEARRYLHLAETQHGPGYASPYQMAMARSYMGEKDAAIEDLQRSAALREGQIFYIAYEPAFDSLHDDVRFQTLEKTVGLRQ